MSFVLIVYGFNFFFLIFFPFCFPFYILAALQGFIHPFVCRYGIYPLTAFKARQPPPPRPRAVSPEVTESVKSVTPEPLDIEARRVVNMMCNVKPKDESCELLVSDILLILTAFLVSLTTVYLVILLLILILIHFR